MRTDLGGLFQFAVIENGCRKLDIPLYQTENANHSLETGDVDEDIREMRKVMKIVREYVRNGAD